MKVMLTCPLAIGLSSAPSLKRRHVALDLSDSENVDPVEFKASMSKRMKTGVEDDLCKPADFTLKRISTPKSRLSSLSALTSRPGTPVISTSIKPTITNSAPAAAGRSPIKPKRQGILSNRRTRLVAPAFGSRSSAPLSLAAAVSGTLANKKNKRRVDNATLEDSKPNSWFFDIYEEAEEQQKEKMLQQEPIIAGFELTESVNSCDISDDEGKTSRRDIHQKENIPPNDSRRATASHSTYTMPSTHAVTSRKDMMTDEPRSPLGDLNPTSYYAEGCDATSVVLVVEDVDEPEKPAVAPIESVNKPETPSSDLNFPAHHLVAPAEEPDKSMTTSQLTDLLLSAAPPHHDIEAGLFDNSSNDFDAQVHDENVEPLDIEIWESGSAKDDAGDMDVAGSIFAEL